MKVLTAVHLSNHGKPTDFAFTAPGELLFKPTKCSSDNHPNCRCPAFAGVQTRGLTNLARVDDVKDIFIDKVDELDESMKAMRETAAEYETGTILEIKPDGFWIREGNYEWPDAILDDND
jgi:hypothetical protein